MKQDELLTRIHVDPQIMVGKPVIRGTRLTVEYVLNVLAHGAPFEELMDEYPGVTRDDILACLLYASRTISATEVVNI